MLNKVVGKEVMIVGDLHFSDVYQGKHKNYLSNCFWVLNQIATKVKENKPSALVLLGDIIGWSETNIRNREVLTIFIKTLNIIKEICPIYVVQGNHDMKGYPDFTFLSELGIIITSSACGGYFDYYGEESQTVPEVRFHMVDYGQEHRHIELCDGATNIVLGHNNYTIEGITNWYQNFDGIELGTMQNFSGVDFVLSGHIHTPSPNFVQATMPNGQMCSLFYLGCPSRPVKEELYDNCWYVFLRYKKENNSSTIDTEQFELKPWKEIFYDDDTFVAERTPEQVEEDLRTEALKSVLDELMTYRIQTGDYMTQIDIIQNASPESKELAKQYLQTAFNTE